MPTLKQLTCNVEWAGSNIALDEYQTTYADGYVETYIAVPPTPTPFSVHLRSNGYIAPGLAMFVYMDGIYQCNRNRHNLRLPDGSTTRRQTEIDFRVRQKEELLSDGNFQGKQWKFEKVNIVSSDSVGSITPAPHDAEYVGIIEVVVLRCCPPISAASPGVLPEKKSSPVSENELDSDDISTWFDGTGDAKPKKRLTSKLESFGLDGSYDPGSPKKTVGNDWDLPISPVGKADENSKDFAWGSWGAPPSPVEKDKDKGWNDWGQPSVADGAPKATTGNSWDAPIIATDNKAWEPFQKSSTPKIQPKGRIEMLNDTEGVMHPSTSKPISERIQEWNRQSKAPGTLPSEPIMSSERGRSQQHSGKRTSLTSPSVNMRGGGPGSYTIDSPRGGRTSPHVVINIAGGPPPPRDWMTEAKAGTYKVPTPPAADDPWTANTPFEDYSKEAETHTAGGEWNWGSIKEKKDGALSQMPGGWGDSTEQIPGNNDWGASNVQDNADDDWGNIANNDTQKKDDWTNDNDKQDDWNNNTAGNKLDTANDDTKKNDLDWRNDNKNTQPNDIWGNANDNSTEKGNTWKASNQENDKKDVSNWGFEAKAPDNQDNPTQTAGKKPDTKGSWSFGQSKKQKAKDEGNKKENEKSSLFSFGSSKGKKGNENSNFNFGSKANDKGPKGTFKHSKAEAQDAAYEKAKAAAAALSLEEDKADGPAKSSINRGSKDCIVPWKRESSETWSPKILSKKEGFKPNFTKTSSMLSLSRPPQPKPYWSSWKEPDTVMEPIKQSQSLDTPLYSIPAEVAKRNNTSHQVLPGKPAAYTHKVSTPKYMDTQENPYAVFVFQYRDTEIIETMMKVTIEEPADVEKQRMASLTKDELVEELMRLKEKEKSGSQGSGSSKSNKDDKTSPKTSPKASEQSTEWNTSGWNSGPTESNKVTSTEAAASQLNITNAAEQPKSDNGNSKDDNKSSQAWSFGANKKDENSSEGDKGGWNSSNGQGKQSKKQLKREEEQRKKNNSAGTGGDGWNNGDKNEDGGEKKDGDNWNRSGGGDAWDNAVAGDSKDHGGDEKKADDWNTATAAADDNEWNNTVAGQDWDTDKREDNEKADEKKDTSTGKLGGLLPNWW